MKTRLIFSLAVAIIVGLGLFSKQSSSHSKSSSLLTIEELNTFTSFDLWTSKHGKQYKSDEQKSFRYQKYIQNYKLVKAHNARFAKGQQTYEIQLNLFADLDNQEFSAIYLGKKKSTITNKCKGQIKHVSNPPAEWDWAEKGAVNPIKNQGQCGSCWAFSTTGSLEGLAFIEKGRLLQLSEQQLVDCSTKKEYGNQGCNGGQMNAAMWYVIDHGITDESHYPYTAKTGTCKYAQSMKVYQIQDCAQVPANKTSSLVDAVIAQPVSISVEANQAGFQLYKSGVFSGACGHKLDHGILLTGYGVLNDKQYWKAKNSWGASWGNKGYILLAKGNDGPGQCGILMQNTVPLKSV